jgi:hypothetical protein
MSLAREYIERIMKTCQRALDEIDHGDKRRTVGVIDEIEHNAEAAKWILINEIKDEEGEF